MTRAFVLQGFQLLAIAIGFAGLAPAAGHSHRNAIPPRLQWNANGGYCGEVSLISAGLYYGQYLSQYEARICAIGKTPQDKGELLLGFNDRRAAKNMHLVSAAWKPRGRTSPQAFLRWVKRQVLFDRPVIIGVYNNEFELYGSTNPNAGDRQYDHIVPVIGIQSPHPLRSPRYIPNDRLVFSDNGLWGSRDRHPYIFRSTFRRFPANRREANIPKGPLYSLPDYGRNYGLVVSGVADRDGDTLPVRVATNKNDEQPAMPRGSTQRPPPMPLTLRVTVSGLQPGTAYRLYRYDRLEVIPDFHFNAHAAAAQTWNIVIPRGSTFSMEQRILSNEVAAYRCVRADAP